MTGLLIVLAGIALLIAALAPAHHRAATPFRPGADLSVDRDHARLHADLTAAAQRQDRGPRRVGRMLGLAGGAVPFHRLSWR
ncbi:MAG TPA: hypothetical protein VFU98_10920 [Microlunatus sp.]|nr:hypothetical protein [Microlunatus sp.]